MATKDQWNLKLLYKSDTDPQIEKDVRSIESAFEKFEKKYKGKSFTSSIPKFLETLKDYEGLEKTLNGYKVLRYFNFKKDLNSKDAGAFARETKYHERITKAGNKVTFFRLEVGKIPEKKQRSYLKDSKLTRYSYLIKVIFDHAKHHLTEKEEQLASLLSQSSYTMWVDGQDKLLSSQVVKHKSKSIPINQAIGMIADLPKNDRRALHDEVNKKMKSISSFAESEINAIYNFKKIMDERRVYEKPYSATVLRYENNEKEVENLVALVTKNFSISKRFYKLHAKLLKEKKTVLADRGVSVGKIDKKFSFANSVEIIKRAFAQVDKQYVKIFESFLENGQIDVYPKEGKTGGAYCAHGGELPTYVLLNHNDNIRSLETIAHEMGHAFHSELSKGQPSHYQDYTIATAEVASTFFEQVAISEIEKELSEKEQTIFLHNKIRGDISTIFRQIAFFNFELELHQRIRKEGQIAKEEIAKLTSKHLRSYLGPAVEVTDDDGYFFVYLSHMRRFFYVYSYAYGQLISRALFEKWQEDKSYSKKIEQFLRAGGSMSPKDIFKSIGIDTSDPKFFAIGLKGIEKDIEKLEKLTK